MGFLAGTLSAARSHTDIGATVSWAAVECWPPCSTARCLGIVRPGDFEYVNSNQSTAELFISLDYQCVRSIVGYTEYRLNGSLACRCLPLLLCAISFCGPGGPTESLYFFKVSGRNNYLGLHLIVSIVVLFVCFCRIILLWNGSFLNLYFCFPFCWFHFFLVLLKFEFVFLARLS